MVSIENKSGYLLGIKENLKLSAFNYLLTERYSAITTSGMNDSDEVYFGILTGIQSNNKKAFETYYNKKNKSKPTKGSPTPFVNDDFLIFCLIIGIVKFGLEKEWIKNIISIRNRTPVTITFENILNEDYQSKTNLPEVVLVFLKLVNFALIDNDLLNSAYTSIAQNISLFNSKSDFHILCAINAENLIINLKEASSGNEISLFRIFNLRFLKRIKVITRILQTAILILILFGLVKLLSYFPSIKAFLDKNNSFFTFVGIFGIGLLGNFVPIFNSKVFGCVLKIFGYPYELLKK